MQIHMDGVTETKAQDGRFLGQDGLLRALHSPAPRTAKDRAQAV